MKKIMNEPDTLIADELQGFAKIVCDCSRGAPVSELVGNIAMSCVRAQGEKHER